MELEKLFLVSDLHINGINWSNVLSVLIKEEHKGSGLVIAGDIALASKLPFYSEFFNKLVANFKHVFIVLGNHDYWSSSLEKGKESYLWFFERYDNVTVLNCKTPPIEVNGKFFLIGDTLWTNFGNESISSIAMWPRTMNDCVYIHAFQNEYKVLSVSEVLQEHKFHLSEILKNIDSNPEKDFIVVTHHAPSEKSVANSYKGSYTNDYYYSDLEQVIMERPNIKKWCHGHMHNRERYFVGGTEILCNAFGYTNELSSKDFFFFDLLS